MRIKVKSGTSIGYDNKRGEVFVVYSAIEGRYEEVLRLHTAPLQ